MKRFYNLKRIKEAEEDIIEIKNLPSKKELNKLNDYANSGKNIWIDRKDRKKYCFNFKVAKLKIVSCLLFLNFCAW